jgi:hypothetical protein
LSQDKHEPIPSLLLDIGCCVLAGHGLHDGGLPNDAYFPEEQFGLL